MKQKEFTASTKTEKIFRWVNISLTIAMALAGVGLAIYYKVAGDPNSRFFPSLGMLIYCAIPFVYELIARSKLPNSVFLIFNIYVAIAALWGSALSGYRDIAFLDIIVHFVMGYLIAALGLFFLCRSGENKKMKPLTVLLFCVFFSLFIEAAWELCERTVDLILNIDIQGEWVEGANAPLLTDTIQDIACNMGGALLFGLHFGIAHWAKKDLGIFSMEREFVVRHKLFEGRTQKQPNKAETTSEQNETDQNSIEKTEIEIQATEIEKTETKKTESKKSKEQNQSKTKSEQN